MIKALGEGLFEGIASIVMFIPELFKEIISGIGGGLGDLVDAGADILGAVKDGFFGMIDDALDWGGDLIDNFIDGIEEKWDDLTDTVSDVASSIADFIGFSEPKKGALSNFHTFAPDMMNLFMKGIKDNEDELQAQVNSTFDIESDIKSGMPDMQSGVPIAYGNLNQAAQGEQTIIIQIDGETFGKFVHKYGTAETERVGTKLTEAVSV
jgi:phage-related protein